MDNQLKLTLSIVKEAKDNQDIQKQVHQKYTHKDLFRKLDFSLNVFQKYLSQNNLLPEDKLRFELAFNQAKYERTGLSYNHKVHLATVLNLYHLAKSFT